VCGWLVRYLMHEGGHVVCRRQGGHNADSKQQTQGRDTYLNFLSEIECIAA